MAATARPGPFATKPAERLIETAEGTRLHRAVGALDLTALGIGAIIGTGIFVIIGEAITLSGPAIVVSFVLAGVTYAYATMGDTLFGVTISESISLPPGEGGDVNVPAFLLVLAVAALLISATTSRTSRPTASAASRRRRR
jgi:hypothetical protein